jgi:CheY-like chemotaxis protein
MVGEEQSCLAAGMDDYLTKPINRDHLIATLQLWTSPPSQPAKDHLDMTSTAPATSIDTTADTPVLDETMMIGMRHV